MAARGEHPLRRMDRDFETLSTACGTVSSPFDQDLESMRLWDFAVSENDREIVVRAEIPGFEPNELDVQINNDMLTIKAEKEQKGERQEEYRSFYRSVRLPPGLDTEKVQPSYRNGVLELHIPRVEGAKPRRITVQAQPDTNGGQAPQGQTKAANGPAPKRRVRGGRPPRRRRRPPARPTSDQGDPHGV